MSPKSKAKVVFSYRGNVTSEAFGTIKTLQEQGLSARAIARLHQLSPTTVLTYFSVARGDFQKTQSIPPRVSSSTKKRIQQRRRETLKLLTKRVKSAQTSHGARTKTTRTFVNLPYGSSRRTARELTRRGVKSSPTTVRRDAKALGLKSMIRPRRPYLLNDDRQRRVAFARKRLRSNVKGSNKLILFTDEKWFDSDDHGNRFQWCLKGIQPDPRGTSQYPKKLLVWGCIGVGVKRLIIHRAPEDEPGVVRYGPGRPKKGEQRPPKDKHAKKTLVSSNIHIKKCLEPLFPKRLSKTASAKVILMQDGAGCHVSQETTAWMRGRNIQVLECWPARSPDLNPIETLWARLARTVSERGPVSLDDLVRFVQEEWDKIPQQEIDALVLSFTKRCQRCVAAKGEHIKV